MDDNRLDKLLNSRRFEMTAPDFADRIIEATMHVKQVPPMQWWLRTQEVLASVMLPRPVAALAMMLVMGIVIGVTLPATQNAVDDDIFQQAYLDDGVVL